MVHVADTIDATTRRRGLFSFVISLYRPEQADRVFCISEKGRHLATASDGVSNKAFHFSDKKHIL